MLAPPETDEAEMFQHFNIPENETIIRQLHRTLPTYAHSDCIEEVRGHRAIMRPIVGHPDVNHYLWLEAGEDLPEDSRWVVRGHAALAHPETKIIFAMPATTLSIQIRLPVSALDECPDIAWRDKQEPEDGAVWVSVGLNKDEDKRLLQIAFDYAGSQDG
jgi:hypothetical protein